MADEMVSVPRELVQKAAECAEACGHGYAAELRACLPWEPPAEQVEALLWMLGFAATPMSTHQIVWALRKGREQGWELRRREEG